MILYHAGGIPRRINTIADNALITAFGDNAQQVAAAHVREALQAIGDSDGWRHWAFRQAVMTTAGAWCLWWWALPAATGWPGWWA